MRYTEYHNGVAVIKDKNLLKEAMTKLAKIEDEEERKHAKPPLGVMPKQIHDLIRTRDLAAAIERYLIAQKQVPEEWINEYNHLINELN